MHMKGFGHIPTNILYFTLNISSISICRDLKQSQKRVKIECFVFTESYFLQNYKVPLPVYRVQQFKEQNSLTRG